uniref:AlNc14C95G5841 protein n=1 Tax=Albugo laibachii Nc14 TaxID=890382 RepID=F0WGW5_9STRA|nr:AlNc14C95G5841 [Albugo laibachii Nc14]|eukprot:CCA20480.1 AlNc14C95G5841 [Albugo laibachii Nc14]
MVEGFAQSSIAFCCTSHFAILYTLSVNLCLFAVLDVLNATIFPSPCIFSDGIQQEMSTRSFFSNRRDHFHLLRLRSCFALRESRRILRWCCISVCGAGGPKDRLCDSFDAI